MNITEGSAKHWKVKFYNNNNNQGSSNAQQFWDLRWFALLSGPLLFGTIILPLIAGPTVRYLCQSYVTLRVYWRLGFVLLAIAYLILFYVFNSAAAGALELMCDIALSIFVSYSVFDAWRFKRRRRVWTPCVFVVLMVWLLDFNVFLDYNVLLDSDVLWDSDVFLDSEVIPTGPNTISFGFFGWIVIVLVLLIVYRRESVAKRRADTRVS